MLIVLFQKLNYYLIKIKNFGFLRTRHTCGYNPFEVINYAIVVFMWPSFTDTCAGPV